MGLLIGEKGREGGGGLGRWEVGGGRDENLEVVELDGWLVQISDLWIILYCTERASDRNT